jgi:GNAT superfamily N-acetyltransferase
LAERRARLPSTRSSGPSPPAAPRCRSSSPTAPAHRRRGVQTALLSARLADAAAAGCDIAVVTTQPGSKSQQNVQRRGFDLLYTRAVLVKEPVR